MYVFEFEKQIWGENKLCIGVDEAGRGAFAGPLVVGAVVFKPDIVDKLKGLPSDIVIRDSKKMTELQRGKAHKWIINNCLDCSVHFIESDYIDEYGLTKATQIGFKNVADNLFSTNNLIDHLLIDGFGLKKHDYFNASRQTVLIKGEDKSFSIAAASILAKVERDSYMKKLSARFPKYNWHQNKGYGTLKHRSAIKEFGLCEYHRKSWSL